ncbi:MAG TPA: PDZ domain-containing protein [Beijerinckiaceae bacterium]|nr:PDZ domain-containing protein [Beijerinckiaceae bacterium]
MELADVGDELRGKFHLDPQTTGPVVTRVTEDTAASGAKLKAGDLVLTVQMEDVRSRADVESRLMDLCNRGQRNVLLFVKGVNRTTRWVTLPLRLKIIRLESTSLLLVEIGCNILNASYTRATTIEKAFCYAHRINPLRPEPGPHVTEWLEWHQVDSSRTRPFEGRDEPGSRDLGKDRAFSLSHARADQAPRFTLHLAARKSARMDPRLPR